MICSKCKQPKKLKEFPLRNGKPRKHCKECAREMSRKHYRENKEYYLERNRKVKRKLRKFLYDFLSENPCVDCGEDDPIVLDFDHQRDKVFQLGSFHRTTLSLRRIKEEMDKCEIRCSNCHRRKTAKDLGWYSGMV